jgi:hypothetical protein
MTQEEQRIAIAEACGWTATVDDDQFWRATRADGSMTSDLWCSMSSVWNSGIPDYLNDLNSMHDAEELFYSKADTLEGAERMRDYSKLLCRIAKYPLRATASQRAEAFLRTISKWEEAK